MTKTVDIDEHKCHFVLFCSFVNDLKKYACEAILSCMVPQVVAWLMLMNAYKLIYLMLDFTFCAIRAKCHYYFT
jgi:hypothetical protein